MTKDYQTQKKIGKILRKKAKIGTAKQHHNKTNAAITRTKFPHPNQGLSRPKKKESIQILCKKAKKRFYVYNKKYSDLIGVTRIFRCKVPV